MDIENIKRIDQKEWMEHAKEYVRDYISNREIYRWLPEDDNPFDHSGVVEKVPQPELKQFLENEEINFWNDSYLDNLYTGEKTASYEPRCGWFYTSFQQEISNELENEYMEKLWNMNVPPELAEDANYRDDHFDELYDEVICEFLDWMGDLLSYFTKEMVIGIILSSRK